MNDWTITEELTRADLVIFYACGLTEPNGIASIRIIRRLQSKIKPNARLVVWGCLPKINPQSLSSVYNGPMIGPKDTVFFEEFAGKKSVKLDEASANYLVPIESAPKRGFHVWVRKWERIFSEAKNHSTFYIHIGMGCVGNCTFCSDRCALGRITSKPIDQIVSEFKQGLRLGYRRFYLVSTDLGGQGLDLGYTLPDLLSEMIKAAHKRKCSIMLNNINPFFLKRQISDLEEVLASGKIETLGSPVQSGSNRILKLMGRRYKIEDWKECMVRIHKEFPNIRLTTQFMVGFPTETEEDFRATFNLLNQVFLDCASIFKFSRRPEVPASYLDGQVPEKNKDVRYAKLYLRVLLNKAFRKIYRSFFIR